MGIGPCVEFLANFADEVAVAVEFQQLGGGGSIGGTRGVAALEDEQVSRLVGRYPRDLAHVHACRGIEEIGGIEGDFRCGLCRRIVLRLRHPGHEQKRRQS